MPPSREVIRVSMPAVVQLAPSIWTGSRLLPSAAALEAAVPGSSFMISNRTTSWGFIVPLGGGELNWLLSTVQVNDPNPDNYQQQGPSSATPPASYRQAIVSALTAQASPQLTIFVHGLGNLLPDAIWGTSSLGANLAKFAGYPGLVIGFDWPSYNERDSAVWYASNGNPYSFPPSNTWGTIRDNINGSTQAFQNLVSFVTGLRSDVTGLTISIVCHSEGNYMALLGLLKNQTQYFDHVLLLAADVNNAVLQAPDSSDPLVGQANGIVQAGKDVTVYFTLNDDVLPLSIYTYGYHYHNPEFGSRMGSTGPSYNAGQQSANVYSVDCSGVINLQNFRYLQNQGVIPIQSDGSDLSMHTSYLFIPQILQDFAALFTGTAPNNIANRQAAANQGAYTMLLNNSNN